MNLTLNADLRQLIDERVKAGKYATPEDLVAAAMLSLDQQERFGDFAPGELDELLAEGERSLESDGTLDGQEAHQGGRQRRARARGQA